MRATGVPRATKLNNQPPPSWSQTRAFYRCFQSSRPLESRCESSSMSFSHTSNDKSGGTRRQPKADWDVRPDVPWHNG